MTMDILTQWIFFVDFIFPLSQTRHLPDLTVYMSNTTGVL